jgi:hypothetical protein
MGVQNLVTRPVDLQIQWQEQMRDKFGLEYTSSIAMR